MTKNKIFKYFQYLKHSYLLVFLAFVLLIPVVLHYSDRPDVLASSITWNSQTSGTGNHLYGVDFVDSDTGWVVGNFGTILKTTDGGISWTPKTSGTSAFLLNVDFADPDTGWAVGSGGAIRKTTDGGTSWTGQTSGVSNNLLGIYFLDLNNGWVVGDNGTILKTVNGGTSWTSQPSGTLDSFRDIYFVNANTGWIAGSNGTILHTADGGLNWIAQISNTSNPLWDIDFIDNNNGWAVGSGGAILKTVNGGVNWTKLPNLVSSAHYDVYFKDINTGLIIGSNGKIFNTTNAGASWSSEISGTSEDLMALRFVNENAWAVGNNGTIISRQTFACGDGNIEGDEECDDSNTSDGDGCSSECAVESGYECSGEPSSCSVVCGNGMIMGDEECDDSNTSDGDGCSSECAVESGYECSGEPSSCSVVCGNGMIMGDEECDDSNSNNGDGCSSVCTVEDGYECDGEPSVCASLDQDGDGVSDEDDECPDELDPITNEQFNGSNPYDTNGDGCADPKGLKESAVTDLGDLQNIILQNPAGVGNVKNAGIHLGKAKDFVLMSLESFSYSDPDHLIISKAKRFFNAEQSAIRAIPEAISKGNITNVSLISRLQAVIKKLHVAEEYIAMTAFDDAMNVALGQSDNCVLLPNPGSQPDSCVGASSSLEKIWMHTRQIETYGDMSKSNCWKFWDDETKWQSCWSN